MNKIKTGLKVSFVILFFVMSIVPAYGELINNESTLDDTPQITIIANDITIEKDDTSFDLMHEVKAVDLNNEEYDVIIADDGGFDVTTVGNYIVIYKIENEDIEPITKERTITVIDKTLENPNKDDDLDKAVTDDLENKTIAPLSMAVSVSNMSELQTAIDTIDEGGVITLTSGFTLSEVELTINHDKNFIIDGGNQLLTAPGTNYLFKFIKNNTLNGSDLTIQNVKLSGNNTSKGIVINGKLSTTYDNVIFQNVKGSALSVEGSNQNLVVRNSTIKDTNEGISSTEPAVYVGSNANLTIENCSFINNKVLSSGWSGGAIRSQNGSGIINIKNSLFTNNSGNRNGGAISIYQQNGVSVLIDQCYFEANEVTGGGNNADGGAISVYPRVRNAHITVSNSTFYNNYAQDDGGAIFLENDGANSTNTLINNTFAENYSTDVNSTLGASSGGAIQISLNTKATMNNNTFYGNKTIKSSWNNGGGAIGRHIHYSDGMSAAYTSDSDLFIDNKICTTLEATGACGNAVEHTKANVSSNITSNTNSVGIDNGTALTNNINAINSFGSSTPSLSANSNSRTAGNPKDGTQRVISLLQILPNNNSSAVGVADGAGSGNTSTDQRGITRGTPADVGAVDILYVEFNANGGKWTGGIADELYYDGSLYYKNDTNGENTEQLKVTNYGSTVTKITANPEKSNKVFIGWNTNKDATAALSDAEVTAILTNIQGNKVLYAIYEDEVEPTGTLIIIKTDLNTTTKLLPNAEFKLVDSLGKTVKEGIKTNMVGKVVVSNVEVGTYKLIETTAPNGYILDQTPRTITITQDDILTVRIRNESLTRSISPFMFTNNKDVGSLQIIAADIFDGEKALEGVRFNLLDESDTVISSNLTTDRYGSVDINQLYPGNYTIETIETPDGYLNEKNRTRITVTAGEQQVVKVSFEEGETNKKASAENLSNVFNHSPNSNDTPSYRATTGIMFTKVYEGSDGYYHSLPGAEIKVTNKDTNTVIGTYTSDQNGEIFLQNIDLGTYIFEEISAPANYQIPSDGYKIEITITAAEPINVDGYIINEEAQTPVETGTLKLLKVDFDSQAPLEGVKYRLLDKDKNEIRSDLTTDATGQIVLSNMPVGTYYWQETTPLSGYVADTVVQDVTIPKAGRTATYQVENALKRATITIVKQDDSNHSIKLANAKFKVSGTNQGKYREYTVITGSDGTVDISNMIPGIYTVEELEAPENYQALSESLSLTVNKGGSETNITPFTINNTKLSPVNATYRVEHYKQQSDGTYTLEESETLSGTVGSTVTATQKTYTGFVCNTSAADTVNNGTILADNSLVLKLYYDKQVTATASYKVEHYKQQDDGSYILEESEALSGTIGSTVTATQKNYDGFICNTNISGTVSNGIVLDDGSLVLRLYYDTKTAATVSYKVEHYKQQSDGSYNLEETEVFVGTLGVNVTAFPKTYDGYVLNLLHPETIVDGIVVKDNGLVLKLHYDLIKKPSIDVPKIPTTQNPSTKPNNNVSTGDTSDVNLLIQLAIVSIVISGIVVIKRKTE